MPRDVLHVLADTKLGVIYYAALNLEVRVFFVRSISEIRINLIAASLCGSKYKA